MDECSSTPCLAGHTCTDSSSAAAATHAMAGQGQGFAPLVYPVPAGLYRCEEIAEVQNACHSSPCAATPPHTVCTEYGEGFSVKKGEYACGERQAGGGSGSGAGVGAKLCSSNPCPCDLAGLVS